MASLYVIEQRSRFYVLADSDEQVPVGNRTVPGLNGIAGHARNQRPKPDEQVSRGIIGDPADRAAARIALPTISR